MYQYVKLNVAQSPIFDVNRQKPSPQSDRTNLQEYVFTYKSGLW